MTMTITTPELALRSLRADWRRTRWEQLPDDGNRYEVIDGVLYMTTAPSPFHQWIIRQLFLALYDQIDRPGIGTTLWSPIGVFMPGCDPVQPDMLVIRSEDLGIIHDRRITGVPVTSPYWRSAAAGCPARAYSSISSRWAGSCSCIAGGSPRAQKLPVVEGGAVGQREADQKVVAVQL